MGKNIDEYGLEKKTKSYAQKRAMVEAMQKSLGIITHACKKVDISRSTHYEWCKEDEAYRLACEDCGELALDFAESKLHELVSGERTEVNGKGEKVRIKEKADTTAVIFFLKTKGKNRGYVERFENKTELSGGIEIKQRAFKIVDATID